MAVTYKGNIKEVVELSVDETVASSTLEREWRWGNMGMIKTQARGWERKW